MRALFLILFATLASCASLSPEARLRTGLIDAGPRQSACMAGRTADNLSLLQLRRIASLTNLNSDKLPGMSVERLLHNLRSLKDAEIVAVTTRAALGCAIGR